MSTCPKEKPSTFQKEKTCCPPFRKKVHGVYMLERKVMVSTCQKESHLPVRKKSHGVYMLERKVMASTYSKERSFGVYMSERKVTWGLPIRKKSYLSST
jgi:hypothetical protein